MARVKRHFSNEFKQDAVRLSYERENIKDLPDELGIQVARIYKWRTAERNPITPKSSGKPQDS
ncbi:MAG: transposase [Flavobacteriales bacterium]|nr:transposase [Flavobacteriales bacterium]